MHKLNLFAARTALILLPASIIAIVFNCLLSQTPFGMIEALWQPSWIALTFSLGILLVMIQLEQETTADHCFEHRKKKHLADSKHSQLSKKSPPKTTKFFTGDFIFLLKPCYFDKLLFILLPMQKVLS